MNYREIIPGEKLKPYIKCYYIFESDSNFELKDTVFPGGYMEIIFNLGEAVWKSASDNSYYATPPVELWGQITKPLPVQTKGKNSMLGIKFYSHSAVYFLHKKVEEFNDQVSDLRDLLGQPVRTLHDKLLATSGWNNRIGILEEYLLGRLAITEGIYGRIDMMNSVIKDMKESSFNSNIDGIASKYGITSRYLQKLFLQYTGITPKMYAKISRFQQSLSLVTRKESSLTSIAYDCGYFDQSHFIREFKSFTGITPSAFSPEIFPLSQTIGNNN